MEIENLWTMLLSQVCGKKKKPILNKLYQFYQEGWPNIQSELHHMVCFTYLLMATTSKKLNYKF